MPELSIIIVNWNSLKWLPECLGSIFATTSSSDFEVIVVDNASTEDETEKIRQFFPQVRTIRSNKNLGFAGANNLGVRKSRGSYLLFLNPDTKVLGSAIDTMLNCLRSTPNVGAVGCKLLNTDGSIQTSCIQKFPTIANQLLDIEFLRLRWPHWKFWGISPLFSSDSTPSDVEVISGACLMMERKTFVEAGMFSEHYFMYAEDVDLCHKVRELKKRAVYVGTASVVHHGGGPSKSRNGSQWVAIMQRRAILKFCERTRGRAYAEVYRFATGMAAAVRVGLLALLIPFKGLQRESLLATAKKWLAVLLWSMGLESQASR
jgi:GT2 family glycosyltransferase